MDLVHRSKQSLFALIIGIDDYIHCQKLRGAVADATAIKVYLEQDLLVPKDQIRTLFDRNATRDAIIAAFKDLEHDERIKNGNPIVIFYAGHGGELAAPDSWYWGHESKIQCILPWDYKEPGIRPIPDRTVGTLIEYVSKAKGDNISVIFDCCHSASGTRLSNDGYVPRTVVLDDAIPGDLDQDIWGTRAGNIASGFAHRGLRSHVLLAACGENERAYEHEGHGQFTSALLGTFKRYSIDDLTYTEVLEHINLANQSPHCEGFNQHRIIFDARVPAGRQVCHSVSIERGGTYVIGAGLAHGITPETEFALYSEQKRNVGLLVVNDAATIEDFQTTVPTSVDLPNVSFAKLTRIGHLPLYLTPGGNLEVIVRQMDVSGTNAPSFRLRVVDDVEEARLEVTMEDNLVVLRVLDQQLKRFGLTNFHFKIPLDRLTHAFGAAAHYYWYLNLRKENNHTDTRDGVVVDFYLLKESEMEYDDYGMQLLVPDGPSLRKRDTDMDVVDFIVKPGALYGIGLTNSTSKDFYVNAFLFNSSSWSIAPYYTQPSVVKGTPKAPLKQRSVFTIGYGMGGMAPFTYSLDDGQDVDVGYLKILFATKPFDLGDIVQAPPFSRESTPSWMDESARKARMKPLPLQSSEPKDTWFTIDIPVVQRRHAVE